MSENMKTGSHLDEMPHREKHLTDYLRVIYKRRWVAIPVLLIVLMTAAINSIRTTPVYDARARILIENDGPAVAGLEELFRTSESWYQSEFYQTQYRILQSRSLARRTIQDLQLARHPAFSGSPAAKDSSMFGTATDMVAGWFHAVVPRRGGASSPAESVPAESDASSDTWLVDSLQAGLTISPVQDSRLVDIIFRSPDPELSARIANGVANAYIEETVEQRFRVTQGAADWLAKQLAEHRQLVEESEAKLQRFREENRTLAVEDGQDIIVQQMVDLNSSVTQARTARLEKEALYNQLSSMDVDQLRTFPAILSNPYIQELRTEVSARERERAELSATFGERHPEMIRVETALREANQKLRLEIDAVVQSVRNEYEAALAKERSLTMALDAQKGEALALNRRSMEFSVLLREAESNRQVYEGLLAQAQETNISSDFRKTNVRIVDAAEVPGAPSLPRTRRDLSLAGLGGLLLAIGFVMLIEYLDNRIKDPDELHAELGLTVIGMVPRVRGLKQEALLDGPLPVELAEAIRSIRTNVLFSSAEAGARVVLVTSPGPGEGKSVLSGSLAWSLGQTEQRVLLIDADMRRPRVHEVLGCPQEPGLSDLLVGQCKMQDAIRKTSVPGVSVITGGHIPPNPAELLGSERFRSYLTGLGESYDWIVVDSPPVLAVTDASVLTNVASGIVMVVGADKTTRHAARTAVERLTRFGARFIGSVLNSADVARSPYYYAGYYRKDYARYYTHAPQMSSSERKRRPSGVTADQSESASVDSVVEAATPVKERVSASILQLRD